MSQLLLSQEVKPGEQGIPILSREFRIGRDRSSDLALADPKVSRRHATLWMQGERYYVRDENSTNGTFVNEKRITGAVELRRGDKLRIGSTVFVLKEGQIAEPRRGGISPVVPVLIGVGLVAMILIAIVVGLPKESVPDVVSVASPTVTPTTVPIAIPTPTLWLAQPEEATVLLEVPIEMEPGESSFGSGSIIAPEGLILTNFHVIGDPSTGDLYNPHGQTYVAVTIMPDGQAQWSYQARPVVRDAYLDLAILEIVSDLNGSPLSSPLALPTVSVGDSDVLQIGDEISILGYPDVGLDTLTVTGGTVSGFLLDNQGHRQWIKTDASISLGNSGGLAVSEAGDLIGVPTLLVTSVGQLGYVRPINSALPLMQQAR
jgi:S1-C subfamily serine protease